MEGANREEASYEEIPKDLVNAFIAIESQLHSQVLFLQFSFQFLAKSLLHPPVKNGIFDEKSHCRRSGHPCAEFSASGGKYSAFGIVQTMI